MGVKLVDPASSKVPPVEALYQSTVWFAPTVTVKGGMTSPAQMDTGPLLTGALMLGQLHSGASKSKLLKQPVELLEARTEMLTLMSILEITNSPPPSLTTSPSLAVTTLALDTTISIV